QPRPSLPRRRGLLASLRAQPDTDVKLTDAAEVDRAYRYWRFRILATTLVGYALFYFVRTNISVALPRMGRDLGYTKAQLGVILTIGGVVYGISKFANGILGDLSNPRYFMAIGLLVSAAMNVLFGLSSALVFLGAFWFLNNWAQGMGFPPCARSMGHWFSPKERGTTFGIWHTGHMIGAALVSVLTGYLVVYDWRLCFFVPAGLAVLGAIMIVFGLRDHPGSMGLPPVEVYRGEETPREVNEEIQPERPYREILVQYVFCNPFLWVISVANFFVYTLRYAGLHWGPTQLQEMKGMSPQASGWVLVRLRDRRAGLRHRRRAACRPPVPRPRGSRLLPLLPRPHRGRLPLLDHRPPVAGELLLHPDGLHHLRPADADRGDGDEPRHQARQRRGRRAHGHPRVPLVNPLRLRRRQDRRPV
ncbi:MAG TPA: MFS transporter, partial [Ardenticatenaceae bacterium]|nr:MFS transporter [Ardenticatenaceae bacterium]